MFLLFRIALRVWSLVPALCKRNESQVFLYVSSWLETLTLARGCMPYSVKVWHMISLCRIMDHVWSVCNFSASIQKILTYDWSPRIPEIIKGFPYRSVASSWIWGNGWAIFNRNRTTQAKITFASPHFCYAKKTVLLTKWDWTCSLSNSLSYNLDLPVTLNYSGNHHCVSVSEKSTFHISQGLLALLGLACFTDLNVFIFTHIVIWHPGLNDRILHKHIVHVQDLTSPWTISWFP